MGADKLLIVGPMLELPPSTWIFKSTAANGFVVRWNAQEWNGILFPYGDRVSGDYARIDIYIVGRRHNSDGFFRYGAIGKSRP